MFDFVRPRVQELPVPLFPRAQYGHEEEPRPADHYNHGNGQPHAYFVTAARVDQVERLLRGHRPIDQIVEQTGLTRQVVEIIRDRIYGRTLPDHHKTARAYVRAEIAARKGVPS